MKPAEAAEAALSAGDPGEALARIQGAVRAAPGDARLRIFLFQLLAICGEWARAAKQLDALAALDPSTELMVKTYAMALHCEGEREAVMAARAAPALLGAPEPWMAGLLEALRLGVAGEHAAATAARIEAIDQAPDTTGSLDGTPFAWIGDADVRFGPMLEAIINGRYFWVPLGNVRRMTIEPPTDLRDLVWLPASFVWTNGGESVGLIPTRYPLSEASPEGAIRLARRTDWQEPAENVHLGLGQRTLMTDAGDHPLLDLRVLEIDEPRTADV